MNQPKLSAPLRDRFAAFLIDQTIIVYLIMAWAYGLASYFKGTFEAHPSFSGQQALLFLSGTGALLFFYYLLSEGVSGTTLGKSLCGLTLVRRQGGAPSVVAIILRNILRVIDYAILPLTAIFMEATSQQLRIGDWFAGTMVIKKQPPPEALQIYDTSRLATATRRSIAFIFDFALFLVWTAAYGLIIIPSQEWTAILFINLAPLVAAAYFILPELLVGATPGKIITATRVVQDDGRRVNLGGSLLRTLFRVIDNNPFGFLCIFLGPRKQRIGDVVGGTLVIRQFPGWRQLLLLIIMVLMIAGMAYLGYQNPKSLIKQSHYHLILQCFGAL